MAPTIPTEIDESNAQFYGVWKMLGRKFANHETVELPGITICWPGAKWPILNVIGLSGPVTDQADLDAKVQQAVSYTRTKPVMGMVVTCTEWLPPDLEERNEATDRKSVV